MYIKTFPVKIIIYEYVDRCLKNHYKYWMKASGLHFLQFSKYECKYNND